MRDHIDFVISQWESTLPQLDASSMKIFGRMLRLIKHLDKKRSLALEEFGLHEGEFDVLATLRRAGHPCCLSPTQLYKALLVTSGAMTNRLNRLEQEGWIERIPDPGDKRSMLVSLTSKGQQQIESALSVHISTQEEILSNLSAVQRCELEALLKTLLLTFPEEATEAVKHQQDRGIPTT